MAKKRVEPAVQPTGYTTPAVPQKTPDRTVQTPKRLYTASGHKSVHGLEPGETGELEITEGQALALIQSGLLKIADENDPPVGEGETKPEDPADTGSEG